MLNNILLRKPAGSAVHVESDAGQIPHPAWISLARSSNFNGTSARINTRSPPSTACNILPAESTALLTRDVPLFERLEPSDPISRDLCPGGLRDWIQDSEDAGNTVEQPCEGPSVSYAVAGLFSTSMAGPKAV